MGIETKDVREASAYKLEEYTEALYGSRSSKKSFYPETTEFKVFKGCVDNESDKLTYESILTKSFKCQGRLKNEGDIAIVDKTGAFDKEGCYHVFVVYLYVEPKEK